jgi:hypothetical protein
MGWRFVKQPNDLYARFSEIVDDFTDCNLTAEQAINVAVMDYNCGYRTAKEKIENADNELIGFGQVPGGKLARWKECCGIIASVHGKKHLMNQLHFIGFKNIKGDELHFTPGCIDVRG